MQPAGQSTKQSNVAAISRQTFTDRLAAKPSVLFLIDGIGAFATSAFIFLLATKFQLYIGLSKDLLLTLAGIALLFALYSFSCFALAKTDYARLITIIIVANCGYCALVISILLLQHSSITTMGLVYFTFELLIILVLVMLEIRVCQRLRSNKGS